MPWNTLEPEVPQDDRIQKSGETAAGSKTDDEACDCDEHGGGCPDSGIFLSEGALEPKEILVPPLVITVSEEEAPVGSGPPPAAMEESAQSTSEADAIPAPPTYLGEFEITGYCSCDICCGKKDMKLTKMETVPKSGYTIAVDPQVIPLGSYLEIEGVTYRAEDIGQAIKDRSLDIFFSSHEEAIEFGRQKKDVYLK